MDTKRKWLINNDTFFKRKLRLYDFVIDDFTNTYSTDKLAEKPGLVLNIHMGRNQWIEFYNKCACIQKDKST